MKKILSFTLALTAIFLTSCKDPAPAENNEKGEGLTSFGFLKADNPSLTEDVACIINEDGTVTGEFTDLLEDYTLIPTFEHDGDYISIGSKIQTSGKDSQDFSKTVIYDLRMKDGRLLKYSVKMTLPIRPQLPVIRINTVDKRPVTDKKNYVPGTFRIEDPDGLYWDKQVFEVEMTEDGIRGRGNSTWGMPKKPYKIKFDEKISLFGLGEDKEWVLLANYADKSLLRNVVAMKLSEIVGMPWTLAMLPVEVYMNDEYLGCYTFSEHKKVSKHRVDLDIVEEGDNSGDAVTGDYYLEIEQQMDETTCFYSPVCHLPMMFSDPEEPTSAQLEYVKNYFFEAETQLVNKNFDPETGWQKYIDIESFAKAFIVNELAKNIDGNMRKSSFIAKKQGGKLYMPHLWDYDIALGNSQNHKNEFPTSDSSPEGWFIKTCSLDGTVNWYTLLSQDPAFCAKVKEIWNKNYSALHSLPNFIDRQVLLISDAQVRNFQKWDILNDTSVWPNNPTKGDYSKHVDFLKNFIERRMAWLDGKFNIKEGEIFQ